jgi:hypothetical protein
MTSTHDRTITIGGFSSRMPRGPVVDPADVWEARSGLPDPKETLKLLARAEEGICIYLYDDSSEECGEDTQPGQRYCTPHTEEMDDAGEETSLKDWRSEIAESTPALVPSTGGSKG